LNLNREQGNIVLLIASLQLTPRQIQEVFRIMGHVFETDEEGKERLLKCIGLGAILISA
jgi:hypothetical protein